MGSGGGVEGIGSEELKLWLGELGSGQFGSGELKSGDGVRRVRVGEVGIKGVGVGSGS